MTRENEMKREKIICSLGHSDVVVMSKVQTMMFAGHEAPVPQDYYHCQVCNEDWVEGELEDKNQQAIDNSRALTGVTSAADSLSYITDVHKISLVRLETAFGLPKRITSKWKASAREQEVNSAAVALLNLVKVYPFLVEAAEASYRKPVADCLVLEYSMQVCARAAYMTVHTDPTVLSAFYGVGAGVTAQHRVKITSG
jgi:hypothetical protein